jgi:hypothetical protein
MDEDLSLRVLQLQCIIDAKDREISLLRNSYANEVHKSPAGNYYHSDQALKLYHLPQVDDPSGVIVQLHEEVKALQEQLNSKDAAIDELQAHLEQLSCEQPSPFGTSSHATMKAAHLANGHAAPAYSLEDEVLTLNVSGHECYVQRSTLLQVN